MIEVLQSNFRNEMLTSQDDDTEEAFNPVTTPGTDALESNASQGSPAPQSRNLSNEDETTLESGCSQIKTEPDVSRSDTPVVSSESQSTKMELMDIQNTEDSPAGQLMPDVEPGCNDGGESSGVDLGSSSFSCGVSFEGVISFNSGDSTCTLSVRIDSQGLFKVVTASVFTFQDLDPNEYFSEDLQSISKREVSSELASLKSNGDSCKSKNNSSCLFLLCFSCNTAYSSVSGLSEHGMLCHNCYLSKDEKFVFEESQCSVVYQPVSCESTEVVVLALDNIREVSLESLKIASRHFVQSSNPNSEDEDASGNSFASFFNAGDLCLNNYAPNADFGGMNSNNLLSHMAMCHSRNSSKTLKCPKCNWHYKYQQTLDAHMKEKHSDSINSCEFCVNNEPHPKLSRGETYSCGYKPFKCEVCNYSTTTKGNLSIHMQSDKHLNNVQEFKRNNGSLVEETNSSSSAVANSAANQSSGMDTSQSIGNSFFKCPACDFQTNTACNFKLHIASEHALLSMSTSANANVSTNDFASALISQQQQHQQQQTTNDLLQSIILQQHLEAVAAAAALTSNAEAASLFSGGLDAMTAAAAAAACSSSVVGGGSARSESGGGVFSCGICKRFCSDDPHLIQNHALRDRTTNTGASVTSQDYTAVANNNTLKCLLCHYSTNLKANFTLHSQTEKHKQKVQIFNHLKEGNDSLDLIFSVIHQISPIQISCNACDFQAKSIGQLSAHLTGESHILAVKLFEMFTSLSSKPGARFNCNLCSSGFLSKSEIIAHVQQPQHCAKLRTKKLHNTGGTAFISAESSWHEDFDVSIDNSAPEKQSSSSGAAVKSSSEVYGEAFNCPLCAKPSRSRDLLREHILQDHRVSSDCIEALLSAVKPTMSVKPVARTPKVTSKSQSSENNVSEASTVLATSTNATTAVSSNSLIATSSSLRNSDEASTDKYKCHRCRLEFSHTLELYSHVKVCLDYLCVSVPECKQSFPTHNALSTHISTHTDQDSGLPCWDPTCGQSFLSEENLIQHFFDTSSASPHLSPALTCSTCLSTFLTESAFSAHVLHSSCNTSSQHAQKTSHAEFKSDLLDSTPILSQYSSSSPSTRPFQCNNCNFAFVMQSNLRTHQSTSHSSTATDNTSSSPGGQAAKLQKTQSEKPFRCDVCDVAYSSESTLMIHLASLLHKDTIKRSAPTTSSQPENPRNSSNGKTFVGSSASSETNPPVNPVSQSASVGDVSSLTTSSSNPKVSETISKTGGQSVDSNPTVKAPLFQSNDATEEVIKTLSHQQQSSSNLMNSSALAALNLLSTLGLQSSGSCSTPTDLKMIQDCLTNQQLMQTSSLMDVHTQMALFQQQQFLLQQQKLFSSLIPSAAFYMSPSTTTAQTNSCDKCNQSFPSLEALTNHQTLSNCSMSSCNTKMSELFKISVGSTPEVTAETPPQTKDQPEANSDTGTNNASTSEEKVHNGASSAVSNTSSKNTAVQENLHSQQNVTSNTQTCTDSSEDAMDVSVKSENSRVESHKISSTGSLEKVSDAGLTLRCEEDCYGNDEDDDNMFYSDELAQSESDDFISDSESRSNSAFASNSDSINNNAWMIQQAALYQQLIMQNPAAFSAILPAAALANSAAAAGGLGSQLLASNPFLSALFSAATVGASAKGSQSATAGYPESGSHKQPRTKISEAQLDILKQNFDISNLPSEERYMAMSQQTGLPVKVIKHWFRNTLFKERQKDKDSPYNFNNPPSSSSSTMTNPSNINAANNSSSPPSSTSSSSSSSSTSAAAAAALFSQSSLSFQQALFNNMQSLLPAAAQFDPTKFSMTALANAAASAVNNSPNKPSSPMSLFLQQQAQQQQHQQQMAASNKRATRTRFTDHQIKSLQDFFDQNPYPRDDDLETLSKTLNLSPRVVVVWFQNQRQKARRSLEISVSASDSCGTQNSYNTSVSAAVATCSTTSSGISPAGNCQQDLLNSSGASMKSEISPTGLDTDATKLVREVVSMVAAVNHNSASSNKDQKQQQFLHPSYSESQVEAEGDSEHDGALHPKEEQMTIVEPQPAPNYDLNCSDAVHSPSLNLTLTGSGLVSDFGKDMRGGNSAPGKAQVQSSALTAASKEVNHDEEFFYNCNLCSAILASEEEFEQHHRAHIEQALCVNGAEKRNKKLSSDDNFESDSLQNGLTIQGAGCFLGDSNPFQQCPGGLDVTGANGGSINVGANGSSPSSSSQEYFRRMRTTISPDQLEVLYLKYGENSNPSRTEMEGIANAVGLSRRVVQVWYQNTRARQRRGQCRVIGNTVYHCKCPYCDTICKSKSHLSQHVQKEHSDRAKNAIQIGQGPVGNSALGSGLGLASPATGENVAQTAYRTSAPPNVTVTALSSPSSTSSAGMNQMNKEVTSTNDSSSLDKQSKQPLLSAHDSLVASAAGSIQPALFSGTMQDEHNSTGNSLDSRSCAHKAISAGIAAAVRSFGDEDESKLHELSFYSDASNEESCSANEMLDLALSGAATATMAATNGGTAMPMSFATSYGMFMSGDEKKRHRTHLSNLQVRTLKAMFLDFKTPSMSECETIGHELGLSKRVVQVWFQNARSKEKKGKPVSGCNDLQVQQLSSAGATNGIVTLDQISGAGFTSMCCRFCPSLSFENSTALRDHLFTSEHVNAVKRSVGLKGAAAMIAGDPDENGYTYALPPTASAALHFGSLTNDNNNYESSGPANTSVSSPIFTPMDLSSNKQV